MTRWDYRNRGKSETRESKRGIPPEVLLTNPTSAAVFSASPRDLDLSEVGVEEEPRVRVLTEEEGRGGVK